MRELYLLPPQSIRKYTDIFLQCRPAATDAICRPRRATPHDVLLVHQPPLSRLLPVRTTVIDLNPVNRRRHRVFFPYGTVRNLPVSRPGREWTDGGSARVSRRSAGAEKLHARHSGPVFPQQINLPLI